MRFFFQVCWLLSVVVTILPLLYFGLYGWSAREAEFLNKVRVGANRPGLNSPSGAGHEIEEYFARFWSKGQADYLERHPDIAACLRGVPTACRIFWMAPQDSPAREPPTSAQRLAALRDMFRARYRELIGRGRYMLPALVFILIVTVESGLVVATAMRTGYDHYIGFLSGEAQQDRDLAQSGVKVVPSPPLDRSLTPPLTTDILPFPPIDLSLTALAAISGAYLFMLTQLIQQCRARTLVYSDLFGTSLRLLVAVPLGLSMTALAGDGFGAVVAFGLGAFPIRELRAILRVLVARLLKFDARADEDQTLAMLGVTQAVADMLADENITCAQQLADIDPVVLAVRTGLSFDYVLFLAAQSLVWCFLGPTASRLGPLGYADARAIWFLMKGTGATPANVDSVLAALAAQIVPRRHGASADDTGPPSAPDIVSCADATLLRQAFEKIARDPYTIFLVHFTSDLDQPAGRHWPPAMVTALLSDVD